MARRILSQNEINSAADALVAAGRKPTIGSVYDKVDRRGSNSTIQKMLAVWEAERGPDNVFAPPAPQIPAPAMEAIRAMGGEMFQKMAQELFSTAKAEADAAVAPVIAGLQAKHAELQDALDTASRIEADREQDLVEAEKALADAEKVHAQDVQHLVDASNTIGHLQGEGEAKAARIATLETSATAMAAEARNQAAKIGVLERDLAGIQSREAAAQERIKELLASLTKAEATTQGLSAKIGILERDLATSTAQEQAAQTRNQDLVTRVATLETSATAMAAEARNQAAKIADQAGLLGSLQAHLDNAEKAKAAKM